MTYYFQWADISNILPYIKLKAAFIKFLSFKFVQNMSTQDPCSSNSHCSRVNLYDTLKANLGDSKKISGFQMVKGMNDE